MPGATGRAPAPPGRTPSRRRRRVHRSPPRGNPHIGRAVTGGGPGPHPAGRQCGHCSPEGALRRRRQSPFPMARPHPGPVTSTDSACYRSKRGSKPKTAGRPTSSLAAGRLLGRGHSDHHGAQADTVKTTTTNRNRKTHAAFTCEYSPQASTDADGPNICRNSCGGKPFFCGLRWSLAAGGSRFAVPDHVVASPCSRTGRVWSPRIR